MAAKIRVYELARELGLTNKETLDLCSALGIGVKSHSSSIVEAQADRVRRKDSLAKATGQSTNFDEEVIAACAASYKASPWLKDRAGAPFGPEQPTPPGASNADRLAAFLGRRV